jgi:hypothetical protein
MLTPCRLRTMVRPSEPYPSFRTAWRRPTTLNTSGPQKAAAFGSWHLRKRAEVAQAEPTFGLAGLAAVPEMDPVLQVCLCCSFFLVAAHPVCCTNSLPLCGVAFERCGSFYRHRRLSYIIPVQLSLTVLIWCARNPQNVVDCQSVEVVIGVACQLLLAFTTGMGNDWCWRYRPVLWRVTL